MRHLLFGVVFGLAFFFSLSFVSANSVPVVNSVTIATTTPNGPAASPIDLSENTTANVYIYGQITDNDGCANLNSAGSVFVLSRSGVTNGTNCTADSNDCYRPGGEDCSFTGCSLGTEPTINYSCTIPVQYFADPTDSGSYSAQNWQAYVEAKDLANATSSLTATTEINSLVALNASTLMDYGTIAITATSTEVTLTITNTGNTAIDAQVSGNHMACTQGEIMVGQQRYSLTSSADYLTMTALSTSAQTVNVTIPQRTGATTTGNVYFQFVVPTPTSSLRGTCGGTNTVAAVLDGV